MDDPIDLCAAGEDAWHAAGYAALASAWRRTPSLAWGTAGTPHRYLFGAVTLAQRPTLPPPLVRELSGIVCDSWASLTSGDLPGWTSSTADPWMVREPGPCVVPAVPGVSVEWTDDALLFEDTAFRAASGFPPTQPGELHPAGSAAVNVDPGLPATLTASRLGLGLYRRLGFRELASALHWRPPQVVPSQSL